MLSGAMMDQDGRIAPVRRFNHELLDDEERQLLLDRIKRLRKALVPLRG